MKIDYDKLAAQQPELSLALMKAGEDNVSAPYALVMMALDRCDEIAAQTDTVGWFSRELFVRELYELAVEYSTGYDL